MAAKPVQYKDGTWLMPGTDLWEMYHNPPKIQKVPNAPASLDQLMKELDVKWRKAEGRKPVDQLTERELMLEGRVPWDPVRLEELNKIHFNR